MLWLFCRSISQENWYWVVRISFLIAKLNGQTKERHSFLSYGFVLVFPEMISLLISSSSVLISGNRQAGMKSKKTSQNSQNVEEFVAGLRFEQRGKLDLLPMNNIGSHRIHH